MILRHGKILSNFLLLRYLKDLIYNSIAELRLYRNALEWNCISVGKEYNNLLIKKITTFYNIPFSIRKNENKSVVTIIKKMVCKLS